LSNPNLTYIRNLRERQNYVSTLPPLQNLNQEPEKKTKLLLYPSTSFDTEGCAADSARGVCFSQLEINGNLRWGTVGEEFFVLAKKITMATWDGDLLELLMSLCFNRLGNLIIADIGFSAETTELLAIKGRYHLIS
jgi:hypothetical protein